MGETTEIFFGADDFAEIKYDDPQYQQHLQAAHVLLFARTSKLTLDQFDRRAIVFMQMRFDGCIGFPGGLVDPGEDPVTAVNRELVEEINYDVAALGEVTVDNHVFSHVLESRRFVTHFFAKEFTEDQMIKMQVASATARDFGDESLGLIQVPLYTMGDSYRGLPAFLTNNFIGLARSQLLSALIKLKIIDTDYVNKSLAAKPPPT